MVVTQTTASWTIPSGTSLNLLASTPANGIISGVGIAVQGGGTLTLGGFNTFTGGLTWPPAR